jgi:hypothetical protein
MACYWVRAVIDDSAGQATEIDNKIGNSLTSGPFGTAGLAIGGRPARS